ncbi:beta-ketoacyl synthase N-terminal-like domain-containing protein [Gilvibacter sediminis]|uniref:beta-ketoacyl synthase N-terminal-like domain-containing protein n=1 Tax=Gilvibacter sediminis TaxID=379071 RepID=UPI00300FEB77
MDRISVLGMSSVSALGSNPKAVWSSYADEKPCFSVIQSNQAEVAVAGVSKTIDAALKQIAQQNSNYKRLDRTVLMAIKAARGSLQNLALDGKWGVNIGSSRGATDLFERYYADFLKNGSAHTLASPTTTLGNVSTWVAQDLQLKAMSLAHSVTCASAMHAVLNGIAWLGSGMADFMLVGGTEAPLTPFTIAQMQALNLYAKQTAGYACRALDLDKKSNTMVLGEAAATAILAKGTHKNAQGYIIGCGWGTEPLDHHTSLSKQAHCFQDSMKMALDSAGLNRVDAVVMHAPGTILGDRAEVHAIQAVFEESPYLISNKHLIGHTLGTSGMMSMELALMMLEHQQVFENPFYNQESDKPASLETVLVNAVGFGGNAVSIILCR